MHGIVDESREQGFKTLTNLIVESNNTFYVRSGVDFICSVPKVYSKVKIFPFTGSEGDFTLERVMVMQFGDTQTLLTLVDTKNNVILGAANQVLGDVFTYENTFYSSFAHSDTRLADLVTGAKTLYNVVFAPDTNILALSQAPLTFGTTTVYVDSPISICLFQSYLSILASGFPASIPTAINPNLGGAIGFYTPRTGGTVQGNLSFQLFLSRQNDERGYSLAPSPYVLWYVTNRGLSGISASATESSLTVSASNYEQLRVSHFDSANIPIVTVSTGQLIYADQQTLRMKDMSRVGIGTPIQAIGDVIACPEFLETLNVKDINSDLDSALVLTSNDRLLRIYVWLEQTKYVGVLVEAIKTIYPVKATVKHNAQISRYHVFDAENEYFVGRDGDAEYDFAQLPPLPVGDNAAIGRKIYIPNIFRKNIMIGKKILIIEEENPTQSKMADYTSQVHTDGYIELGYDVDRTKVKVALPIRVDVEPIVWGTKETTPTLAMDLYWLGEGTRPVEIQDWIWDGVVFNQQGTPSKLAYDTRNRGMTGRHTITGQMTRGDIRSRLSVQLYPKVRFGFSRIF
jgi:hypothetical protein